MSRNNPPDILAAQAKLLEVAQRQTVMIWAQKWLKRNLIKNEEIQKKLEMLGKQVAAAQAHANAQALRTAQTTSRKQQVQNQTVNFLPIFFVKISFRNRQNQITRRIVDQLQKWTRASHEWSRNLRTSSASSTSSAKMSGRLTPAAKGENAHWTSNRVLQRWNKKMFPSMFYIFSNRKITAAKLGCRCQSIWRHLLHRPAVLIRTKNLCLFVWQIIVLDLNLAKNLISKIV